MFGCKMGGDTFTESCFSGGAAGLGLERWTEFTEYIPVNITSLLLLLLLLPLLRGEDEEGEEDVEVKLGKCDDCEKRWTRFGRLRAVTTSEDRSGPGTREGLARGKVWLERSPAGRLWLDNE